jgi:hypothetical protein
MPPPVARGSSLKAGELQTAPTTSEQATASPGRARAGEARLQPPPAQPPYHPAESEERSQEPGYGPHREGALEEGAAGGEMEEHQDEHENDHGGKGERPAGDEVVSHRRHEPGEPEAEPQEPEGQDRRGEPGV